MKLTKVIINPGSQEQLDLSILKEGIKILKAKKSTFNHVSDGNLCMGSE